MNMVSDNIPKRGAMTSFIIIIIYYVIVISDNDPK